MLHDCTKHVPCLHAYRHSLNEFSTAVPKYHTLCATQTKKTKSSLFRTLRIRYGTKFHVQLSVALFFMLLVFVIGINRIPPNYAYEGCVTVSALIQYFTLVAFMWMGAEALLMFQKLVIVFIQITTKYIIAVSFICWCKSVILRA